MTVWSMVLVTAAAILLSAETGRACTCAGAPSVAQARDQAAAVFSGRVVKVKRVKAGSGPERVGWFNLEVVFAVTQWWKGVERPTVSVFTNSQSSACGYGFRSGRSYLVYAQGVEGGRLATGICGRTRRMKDAREDLKELGGGEGPGRNTGRRWREA